MGNKRVLAVDDEPAILRVLSIQLRLGGYEVITTTSGREAVELISTAKPDVVLLDILLPDVSGLDVLERVRAFSEIPVIAFTANSKLAEDALKLGANDYLPKPFYPDILFKKIESVLSRKAKGTED